MRSDDILFTLNCAIQSRDSNLFINFLRENDVYLDEINLIISKMRECISNFCNDLLNFEQEITTSLVILQEIIKGYDCGTDEGFCIARIILLLVTDEKCSFTYMKHAIIIFKSLIKNPTIRRSIINDESLEGCIQILGRKIPMIGDYEIQSLLFEVLYQITDNENREYWTSIWFSDMKMKHMFLNLDPQKIEIETRTLLNYLNSNELERRVFSVKANSIYFGNFQLKQPYGYELWVDFNYDSHSVSFYSFDLSIHESAEYSVQCEIVSILDSSVSNYSVKAHGENKLKEICFLLNRPCFTLTTASETFNPDLNSLTVKILCASNNVEHLVRIFGKDKLKVEQVPKQIRKISNISEVIKTVDTESESYPCNDISQRKISDSVLIPVDSFSDQVEIPETQEIQKFKRSSQSYEIIKVTPENEADLISYTPLKYYKNIDVPTKRKVSFSSQIIEIEDVNKYQGAAKKRRKERFSENGIENSEQDSSLEDISELGKCHEQNNEFHVESVSRKPVKESPVSSIFGNDKNNDNITKDIPNQQAYQNQDSMRTNDKNKNELCSVKERSEENSNSQDGKKFDPANIPHQKDSQPKELSSIKSFKIPSLSNETNMPTAPEEQELRSKVDSIELENFKTIDVLENSHEENKMKIPVSEMIVSSPSALKADKKSDLENSIRNKTKRIKKETQRSVKKCSKFAHKRTDSVEENENFQTMKEQSILKSKTRKLPNDLCLSNEKHVNVQGSDNNLVNLVEKNNFKTEQKTSHTEEKLVSKNLPSESIINKNLVNAENLHFEHRTKSKENITSQRKINSRAVPKQVTLKHVNNMVCDADPSNEDVHKKLEKFSTQVNNLDSATKVQQKKIRLYNLESAPVYDVPPFNGTSTEKNGSMKNLMCENGHTDHSSETELNHELKNRDDAKDSNPKILYDSGRPNNKKSKGSKINLHEMMDSDSDFDAVVSKGLRKQQKKSVSSTRRQKEVIKRKSYVDAVYSLDDSESDQSTRPLRKPRKAALRARRVNKKLLDFTPEIVCDEIEFLSECDNVCRKRKKHSKKVKALNTDTETGSSEVSWLKPKKKSRLFESPPKKTYARPKNYCKRQLPLKVISNAGTSTRKTQRSTGKKIHNDVNMNKKFNSRSKSAISSDLDSFNLTIEKSTRKSYPVTVAMENVFQNFSGTTHKRNNEKDSPNLISGVLNSNQGRSEHHNRQHIQSCDSFEIEECDNEEIRVIDKEICDSMLDFHENSPEEKEVSKRKYSNNQETKEINNELYDSRLHVHDDISEEKEISKKKDSIPNLSSVDNCVQDAFISSTQDAELNQSLQSAEESKHEKILQSEKDYITNKTTVLLNEDKGKKAHLEKYLECVLKCLQKRQKKLVNGPESNESNNSSKKKAVYEPWSNESNFNSNSNRLIEDSDFCESYRREKSSPAISSDKSKRKQDTLLGNLKVEAPVKKNRTCKTCREAKQIAHLKTEGCKETEISNEISNEQNQIATLDSLCLRSRTTSFSEKSFKIVKSFPKSHRKNSPAYVSNRSNIPEKSRKSAESHRSENLNDSISKATILSLEDIESDKKWFSEITSVLSSEADVLTRRLLGTVQKCYNDYSEKLYCLRENIARVADSLELKASENLDHYKLSSVIKSCSLIRSEVQKSLVNMELSGKEYFEAEARYYRKLRRKHIKASKKYLLSMKEAEKRAIQKMEKKALLKTRHFFKKFLKHMNSS